MRDLTTTEIETVNGGARRIPPKVIIAVAKAVIKEIKNRMNQPKTPKLGG